MKNESLWEIYVKFKIFMRKVKSLLKQTTPLQICSAPFLNSPEHIQVPCEFLLTCWFRFFPTWSCKKASCPGFIIIEWVARAQTYQREKNDIKDTVIFITGFRIYDLSLAWRQMKLVDRTRECGCSGLPRREYLAKRFIKCSLTKSSRLSRQ